MRDRYVTMPWRNSYAVMSVMFWVLACIGSRLTDSTFHSLPGSTSTEECKCYNHRQCESNKYGISAAMHNETEICPPAEKGKRSHCFALLVDGAVFMMGCWLNEEKCYDRRECVGNVLPSNTGSPTTKSFCCCDGNMCNAHPQWPVNPVVTGVPLLTTSSVSVSSSSLPSANIVATFLLALCPLVVISVVVIIIVILWRRRAAIAYSHRLPTQEDPAPPQTPPNLGIANRLLAIQKIEMKARGRFGSVWKSKVVGTGAVVAIKVFPPQDRQSWLTEQQFYNLIRATNERFECHPNVLRFIAAEQRMQPGPLTELWLVTEYHERGSLYDYLKGSPVTMLELLRIAQSMYSGLAYIHAVIPEAVGEITYYKPSVAHRDIKSRNVLLKNDLTACIADFGLALVLKNGPGDVHNQVGTRRYMAPEVLDGSINFSIDSFLKIDVYASALILWELLSRCSSANKGPVGEYRMPFEKEAGTHPSLEVMQDLVVIKKSRPQLAPQWLESKVASSLCSTMEECWDQDPEARLSAECVESRLSLLLSQQTISPSTTSSIFVSVSPLLFDKDPLTTFTTSSSAVV